MLKPRLIMNPPIAKPRLRERWRGAERLALMAAFEDSATCARVKEFCQSLSRDLGERCKIIQHVWVFSTFRMTELQEIAAEEAALADMVVLAARQAESLPEEVKSWLEMWLQHKGDRKAVLVALLDRTYDGAPNPIRACLQQVATRGGFELLVEVGEG
jgi:hypothetical protein